MGRVPRPFWLALPPINVSKIFNIFRILMPKQLKYHWKWRFLAVSKPVKKISKLFSACFARPIFWPKLALPLFWGQRTGLLQTDHWNNLKKSRKNSAEVPNIFIPLQNKLGNQVIPCLASNVIAFSTTRPYYSVEARKNNNTLLLAILAGLTAAVNLINNLFREMSSN